MKKGITIIELLVTLVILSILGTVIFLSLKAGYEKTHPKGEITNEAWTDSIE